MKSVHRYSLAAFVTVGVIVGGIVLLLNQGPSREGGASKAASDVATQIGLRFPMRVGVSRTCSLGGA
jgi:hypothetical protein